MSCIMRHVMTDLCQSLCGVFLMFVISILKVNLKTLLKTNHALAASLFSRFFKWDVVVIILY
jgi:hypothetical protein